MFKRLIVAESSHKMAVPIAISVMFCIFFKAVGIRGTSLAEYLDVSVTVICCGGVAGIALIMLSMEDRLAKSADKLDAALKELKQSQKKSDVHEIISTIGSISREISEDVKRLEEREIAFAARSRLAVDSNDELERELG